MSGSRGPLYPRLLRLRHVRPNAWQRALLGEGAIVAAGLLVLADVATAWALLVVPLVVALLVKAHDVLAGLLAGAGPQQPATRSQLQGEQTEPQAEPVRERRDGARAGALGDPPGAR